MDGQHEHTHPGLQQRQRTKELGEKVEEDVFYSEYEHHLEKHSLSAQENSC